MGLPEYQQKGHFILNNQSPTYLNSSTGSYSAIDITLSDP